jgi:lipopolysaccharide biosynthesis regulator YciM
MLELLWLLLPVAAASGWWAARREQRAGKEARALSSDYLQGLYKLLHKKPNPATDVFTQRVALDQDAADIQRVLGNLFRRHGEVDRAISIHSDLLAKLPLTAQQRSQVILELGEDYRRAGLFDRAETLFRGLVEQLNHTAIALARLIDIYEQGKDWQQAIEYSDRLERLTGQPRRVETAHYCCELAEAAWQRLDHREAQACLRQALERDPHCVRASILRGHMAMLAGDYLAAITAFQAVPCQNQGYFAEVITPLGKCYAALGRQAELIEYLRDMQGRDQTGRATDALAALLLQQAGEDAALEFLETELQSYPTLLGLRRLVELKLAQCEEQLGHSDLKAIYRISLHLLTSVTRYQCDHCGFAGKLLHWRCPHCKSWSSIKPISDLVLKNGLKLVE